MYGRLFFASKAKRLGIVDSVKDALNMTLDEWIIAMEVMKDIDEETEAMIQIGVAQAFGAGSEKEGEGNGGLPPV